MKILMLKYLALLICFGPLFVDNLAAQKTAAERTFSGVTVTQLFELVPNVSITADTSRGRLQVFSDSEGRFSLKVPNEAFSVRFDGKGINQVTRIFSTADRVDDLQIKISYLVSPVNESVTIQAESVTPEV